MTFCEALNMYVKQLGCQAKELAEASGMRTSMVTRCLNGTYIPAADNDGISKLAKGIVQLSEQNSRPLTYEEVFQQLSSEGHEDDAPSYRYFSERVRTILKLLHISHAEFAREMHLDPSTISRHLSGRKKPSELASFSADFSAVIANRTADEEAYKQLAEIFGCSAEELRSPAFLRRRLLKWIAAPPGNLRETVLDDFLAELDTISLRDYEEQMDMPDTALPSVPYIMPALEIYHGTEEFKQCELNFLKASVLARSHEDIIMYSDMPIHDLMEDAVFRKRYQFGMSLLIKKGIPLHVIQDTQRSVRDILLDMKRMIPLYMTGKAKLYYFPKPQRDVFSHLIRVSGAAAMYGIAVSEVHQDGVCMLTKNKGSVTDYRRTAKAMLRSARPFIEVFSSDQKEESLRKLASLSDRGGRRMIVQSPPIFTASEALMQRILRRHKPDSAVLEKIMLHRQRAAAIMNNLLKTSTMVLEMPEMSKQQFEKFRPTISLSELFFDEPLHYTYEEYCAHLHDTKQFAAEHKNFFLRYDPEPVFRSLHLLIIEDYCVMINKSSDPPTRFIIYHPNLVRAFERYVPPLPESEKE